MFFLDRFSCCQSVLIMKGLHIHQHQIDRRIAADLYGFPGICNGLNKPEFRFLQDQVFKIFLHDHLIFYNEYTYHNIIPFLRTF